MKSAGPSPAPTRVLFLAWGESIHARRRISLFANDPAFDVAVASTFNYGFPRCRNYLLSESSPTPGFSLRFILAGLRFVTKGFLPFALLEDLHRVIGDIFRLRKAYKEFQPEIVFLQTLLYPCYLAYLLPKKTPQIVTFWNGDVIWWAKWNGIERLFKKWLVTYGARRAIAVTVNSQEGVDACLNYGLPRENIHLIRYPGLDLSRFHPKEKDDTRERLELPKGRIVLCPRGLGGYLNSEVIVSAVAEVVRVFPDATFIFLSAQKNSNLAAHRALADRHHVAEHIRWMGHVAWEDMPGIYRAANVMVSISSNDSLPNCMLEAMGCGVPVVMGDIPPIREWIDDDVNGFLVPPEDATALGQAILKILGNENACVPRFVEANLALVRRELDSEINCRRVKDLVVEVACKGQMLT